jgi:lysyl-tRNA synthetase class 1
MTDSITPAALREAALDSKAWPYEEARKLLKRYRRARRPRAISCSRPATARRACRISAPSTKCCARRWCASAYQGLSDIADAADRVQRRYGRPAQGARQCAEPGDAARASRQAADQASPIRSASSKASRITTMRCCANSSIASASTMNSASSTEAYEGGRFDEALKLILRHYDGDHGRDAADAAQAERAGDLFAGAADQPEERDRAAGAGRGGRCRNRHDPLRG